MMSSLLELVGKPLEWLRRVIVWVVGRLRADHATIIGPSQFGFIANGSLPRLHVSVQVAPSRRLRRRLPALTELVRSGTALVDAVAPQWLPSEPAHLDGALVMFKVEEAADGFVGYVDRALVLRTTGFAELFWPVGESPPESGPYDLPVIDILEPLMRMSDAVRTGAYWRAVTGRTPRRAWRQRVDWRIWIAWTAQAGTSNMRNWTGLVFPAASPAHRATAGGVHFSTSPLGAGATWNVPQAIDPRHLLAAVVEELLRWCGYYGDEDKVIAETVNVVMHPRPELDDGSVAIPVTPPTYADPMGGDGGTQ